MGNYRNTSTSVLLFPVPELTILFASNRNGFPINSHRKTKQKTKLGDQVARLELEHEEEGEEAGLGSRHPILSTNVSPTSKLVLPITSSAALQQNEGSITNFRDENAHLELKRLIDESQNNFVNPIATSKKRCELSLPLTLSCALFGKARLSRRTMPRGKPFQDVDGKEGRQRCPSHIPPPFP